MTFEEYRNIHGLSISEVIALPSEIRLSRLMDGYWRWANNELIDGVLDLRPAEIFQEAWNLCKEVMVFQHLDQDARAAAEKAEAKIQAVRQLEQANEEQGFEVNVS